MAAEEKTPAASGKQSEDERSRRLVAALQKFIAEFSKESDRAAVILVGARLDYLLGELLSRFLLPNTGSSDELLDTERALGTFSARINSVYRLGLIDADFTRTLHIFRRLRNTFAHESVGVSFDHGPSRDRIRELVAPVAHLDAFQELRQGLFKEKPERAADFFAVAALLVARLEVACSSVEQVDGSNPARLIPTPWEKTDEANA